MTQDEIDAMVAEANTLNFCSPRIAGHVLALADECKRLRDKSFTDAIACDHLRNLLEAERDRYRAALKRIAAEEHGQMIGVNSLREHARAALARDGK